MSGNVYEWCADWYDNYPSNTQTNPTGPASGFYRVLRCGSWNGDEQLCRSMCRNRSTPEVRFTGVGFRLASSPQ